MQIIVQEIDAFTYCWISKTTKAVCMHDVPASMRALRSLWAHWNSFIYLHRFWITSVYCVESYKNTLATKSIERAGVIRAEAEAEAVIWKPYGGENTWCIHDYVYICRWIREWVESPTNTVYWYTLLAQKLAGNSFLVRMTFNKTSPYRYSDSILDLST